MLAQNAAQPQRRPDASSIRAADGLSGTCASNESQAQSQTRANNYRPRPASISRHTLSYTRQGMNTSKNFFVDLALEKECQSIIAATSIRKYALKKNGNQTHTIDENILPTPDTLRRADSNGKDIGKGAFTPGRIAARLRCTCVLCHEQNTAVSDNENLKTAHEIYEKDHTLNFFAILCLSGCLFAARKLHTSGFTNAESLPQVILAPIRHELRVILFSRFGDLLPTSITEERHDFSVARLAQIFADCFQYRAWLTAIPTVGRHDQFQPYGIGYNMPFIQESTAKKSQGNRSFFKFMIHPTYCANHSEDLKGVFLFRKEIKYECLERRTREAAQEECSILNFIKDLKHPNIVELLWAYSDTSRTEHYTNLIFPWYEFNLEDVLENRIPLELLKMLVPESLEISVLDSGLWKAFMGIIAAIETIHSPENRNVPRRTIGSHFDIKPQNILLDKNGKLILADFGQAHIKPNPTGQRSDFTGCPGTREYAPPPLQPGSKLSRSYDVWSTACVAFEILTFLLLGGAGAVQNFGNARYEEAGSDDRNGAFWIAYPDGRITLRQAVSDRMAQLRQKCLPRDQTFESVLHMLSRMFAIDEKKRPTMKEVQDGFNNEGQINFDIFIGAQERELMRHRLRQLPVSITTERQIKPLPCQLFLWRQRDRRSESEGTMRLVLSTTAVGSYGESTTVESDTFLPISLFDCSHSFSMNYQAANMLQCRFMNLHRPTTLHFHRVKDFFDFQGLTTFQIIHTTPDVPFARAIKFTSGTLETNKYVRSYKLPLSGGRLFIWRTLQESRYYDKFATMYDAMSEHEHSSSSTIHEPSPSTSQAYVTRTQSNSTVATKSPHQRKVSFLDTSSHAKFKLAVFTSGESTRSCIILDLIPNGYTIQDNEDAAQIEIKRERGHDAFPVAMFGWRVGDKISAGSDAAGIPLSPKVVETEIENGVRLRSLILKMEQAADRQTFLDLYRSLWAEQKPGDR